MPKAYLTAKEIAEIVGVSQSMAYTIIRKLNAELAEKNFITIKGKVPVKFFSEKYYGYEVSA